MILGQLFFTFFNVFFFLTPQTPREDSWKVRGGSRGGKSSFYFIYLKQKKSPAEAGEVLGEG